MATGGNRSRQAMWTKLAAASAETAKTQRFFRECADPTTSFDRLTAIRCGAFKDGAGRLRAGTSGAADERSDVHRPGGGFHSGGTQPRPQSRLSPHHSRPHYSARGNRGHLLPERALLRIIS